MSNTAVMAGRRCAQTGAEATITSFIWRTAAVTVLAPIIVPGCCLVARVAA